MSFIDHIVSDAKTRARRRRQLYCVPEQLLECLYIERDERAGIRLLAEYLDARERLAFEPSIVEVSRSARQAVDRVQDCQGENGSRALEAALLELVDPDLKDAIEALRATAGKVREGQEASTVGGQRGGRSSSLLKPLKPDDSDDVLVDRPQLVDRALLTLMIGSPLLIGHQGSGRRSLIRLVLRRVVKGNVPRHLKNVRLFELDPSGLVAGTKYRGELEQKVQHLIEELLAVDGKPVLVIENLAGLAASASESSGTDPLAVLIPHVRAARIGLAAIVTRDELREQIESRPALNDVLVPVHVPEVTECEAEKLLEILPKTLANTYGVSCSPSLVNRAIELVRRYAPQAALPGSARRLLEGAGATLAYESEMLAEDPERTGSAYWRRSGGRTTGVGNPAIVENQLVLAVADQYRIPFEHLDTDRGDKIDGFRDSFKRTIFGQDHTLPLLSATLKVALASLEDSKRPRGRLFFVGPPGTGKTESAKLLAKYFLGNEDSLLRFNMSEFSDDSSVASMIGSDRGLVGSDEGGRLTEPLRENPHRIILFDEIEKASAKVFNLFLQILDNGQITDKQGRMASFRHSICIFTSNVGCEDADLFGLNRSDLERRLRSVFSREFVDRLEVIVPFRELTGEARRGICEYQLRALRRQAVEVHGVEVDWTSAVIRNGAGNGERHQSGARDILRWIQCAVKPAVVDALDSTSGGSSRLRVDVNEEGRLIASDVQELERLANAAEKGNPPAASRATN